MCKQYTDYQTECIFFKFSSEKKNARSVIVTVTQVDEIRPFSDYTLFDLVS